MMGKEELYVGVDLGGTNIQSGLVKSDGTILARDKRKTKAEGGDAVVVERIAEAVAKLVKGADVDMGDVAAVGVGSPGAIDDTKGIVLTSPNLRWNNFPLAEVLGKHLKPPVVVDNDVNVGAWGEYIAGAGRELDIRDMLAVFVGTGVGGGLILNGELYRGHHRTAGEIGHTVLHANGPLGRRTLENFASRTAVVNLLRELIAANHPSVLAETAGPDLAQARSKVLKQAVEQGDALSIEVIRNAARYVGISIANVVTLLSLPAVVLGGGLTEALGQQFVDWVQEAYNEVVFPADLRQCQLLAGTLGDDAGLVGAALLARAKLAGMGGKEKKVAK